MNDLWERPSGCSQLYNGWNQFFFLLGMPMTKKLQPRESEGVAEKPHDCVQRIKMGKMPRIAVETVQRGTAGEKS